MSRPHKPGIDYFPLSSSFLQDRKVRRITRRFQASGVSALITIYSLIYQEKGFYINWNEDTLFDLAQDAFCTEQEIKDIIEECLVVEIFDRKIFELHQILTSRAIQEQYLKIITDARRKAHFPQPEYWMLEQKQEEKEPDKNTLKTETMSPKNTRVNATETIKSVTLMPQTETDIETEKKLEKERESGNEKENKPKETIRREDGKEAEASPAVKSLSIKPILDLNLKAIGIRDEATVRAINALSQRTELNGLNGTLWKVLSQQYRPILVKKDRPGDYILWALNHPKEFEETYTGLLQKAARR